MRILTASPCRPCASLRRAPGWTWTFSSRSSPTQRQAAIRRILPSCASLTHERRRA